MVRVLLVATKYKNVKIKIIYATVVKYYQLFLSELCVEVTSMNGDSQKNKVELF